MGITSPNPLIYANVENTLEHSRLILLFIFSNLHHQRGMFPDDWEAATVRHLWVSVSYEAHQHSQKMWQNSESSCKQHMPRWVFSLSSHSNYCQHSSFIYSRIQRRSSSLTDCFLPWVTCLNKISYFMLDIRTDYYGIHGLFCERAVCDVYKVVV